MPDCEICGSADGIYKAKIEGALLNVCKNCMGSGEIVSRPEPPKVFRRIPPMPEGMNSEISENISAVVKAEREKMGLTRKELANKLQIQENLIGRIENGWNPALDIIKKLEKFFRISLAEK